MKRKDASAVLLLSALFAFFAQFALTHFVAQPYFLKDSEEIDDEEHFRYIGPISFGNTIKREDSKIPLTTALPTTTRQSGGPKIKNKNEWINEPLSVEISPEEYSMWIANNRVRRAVGPKLVSNRTANKTPTKAPSAFFIGGDFDENEETDDDVVTAEMSRPTTTRSIIATKRTTTAAAKNKYEMGCVKKCKVALSKTRKEAVSCKHFMQFRNCLTRLCQPTNRGYAMVIREMQLAIDEEICHIRDTAYSAKRIAACDRATAKKAKELGEGWATCNKMYVTAKSLKEICTIVQHCYLQAALQYPMECQYARRFMQYFVLAEFTETSNGQLATKCPHIFPIADVDAY